MGIAASTGTRKWRRVPNRRPKLVLIFIVLCHRLTVSIDNPQWNANDVIQVQRHALVSDADSETIGPSCEMPLVQSTVVTTGSVRETSPAGLWTRRA